MLLGGIFVMAACSDDRDDNPTIKVPTEFKMETPSFASSQVNLNNAAQFNFAWEKPDFGYSAKVNYTLEVSNTGKFTASPADEEADLDGKVVADYAEISTIFPLNKATITNDDLALAIVQVGHWEKPEQLPATQKVYMRVKAALPNVASLYSNVVEFTVVPKYVKLPAKITECYLTGSEYGWGNNDKSWKPLTPVKGTIGKQGKGVPTFWMVAYFKAGEQFKFAPKPKWGDDFGAGNATVTDHASASPSDEGGNIKVGKAGWYLIVVTNNGEKRTVSFEKPEVYLQGPTIGNWDCKKENKFTAPTTADGEFVSPAFVATDKVRMCVKLKDFDWWKSEFIVNTAGNIVYRGDGNDPENITVTAGQRCYLNFSTGKGSYK